MTDSVPLHDDLSRSPLQTPTLSVQDPTDIRIEPSMQTDPAFVNDGFDRYLHIPPSMFDRHGVQATDAISHLATLSLGFESGKGRTGLLFIDGSNVSGAAQSYLAQLPQSPKSPTIANWKVEFEYAQDTEEAPLVISQDLPAGRIEGRLVIPNITSDVLPGDNGEFGPYIKFRVHRNQPYGFSEPDSDTQRPISSVRSYVSDATAKVISGDFETRYGVKDSSETADSFLGQWMN